MSIKFGPAGIGPLKDIEETFEGYKKLGICAAEIPFTYGVYIKKKEDALKVKKAAQKNNIKLSIHAPYWINLNSNENEKVQASKKRILDSCKIGHWLGAKRIVFHPGYYGKRDGKDTYENIKQAILDMQEEIKKNKWNVELCPETSGKVNVFGSIEDILRLIEDTGCSFCIDFAHILARYKTYNFKEISQKFKKYKKWHVHFSGIEYGDKGEKYHKRTSKKEIKRLLENLPKNKNIIIINESPYPIEDSAIAVKIYKKLR